MTDTHFAVFNVATLRWLADDPREEEFAAALAPINQLAEESPGFVWRFPDASTYRPFGDQKVVINMSVWESLECLRDYVYGSKHGEYLRRRKEWFDTGKDAHGMVLWRVPIGHQPTIEEGKEKFERLRAEGPSELLFTL